MDFKDKVAVITGGLRGIGFCIADEFRKKGASVCIIDKDVTTQADTAAKQVQTSMPDSPDGNHLSEAGLFVGDLADKRTLERFAAEVIDKYGRVDYLINNAKPLTKGIDECSYEEFQYALSVGVTAPFYLAKLFMPHFAEGAAIVNISSSRDRMSQPQTESYTAAKGGIAALTHALSVSLAGKARVNSISPGWIDTDHTVYEGPDAVQQPAGRVGNPLDIANMVLYLCSDKAGFITGENICIDGGMTRQMIYHGDNGWTLKSNKE
ncbi:MAG: SDR family oxidoreductase [Paludibacteraceae bacterium]|nr:SDR family oxidoreductase [Paludibacteraceae bacterium]